MRLDSDHYYQAALERIRQARGLYERGDSYSFAIYVAGLAVECMLRAFRLRLASVLDERHDLLRLFETCGIMNGARKSVPGAQDRTRQLKAAIQTVSSTWANDFRYASDQRLRIHLRLLKLHLRIKGDWLKANALRVLKAAEKIAATGAELWTPFKRK